MTTTFPFLNWKNWRRPAYTTARAALGANRNCRTRS
jgi:hypothetical protein